MKTKEKIRGDLGEEITKNYFLERDFDLVDRNYWQKFGEIDLIFKKDGELYFVEVKTGKKGDLFFDPLEHLNKSKIKKFRRIVEFYIQEKKLDFYKNSFGIKQKVKYNLWAVAVYLDEDEKKANIKIIRDLNF